MDSLDTRTAALLYPALALPKGDDGVWDDHRIVWKNPETWMPELTAWLEPDFARNWHKNLQPGKPRELCWDDSDWIYDVLDTCLKPQVDTVVLDLASTLKSAHLLCYHACRTDDVGSYLTKGIQKQDRSELSRRVHKVVDAHETLSWMKSRLDKEIADVSANPTDNNRVFVVADDALLVKDAGHYLIYGSEWINAVLGEPGRRILKSIGLPTIFEIDLPLSEARDMTREEFARAMLIEWTRQACNRPDWHAPIDFTIVLHRNVPKDWITGHRHPAQILDPYSRGQYASPGNKCKHC